MSAFIGSRAKKNLSHASSDKLKYAYVYTHDYVYVHTYMYVHTHAHKYIFTLYRNTAYIIDHGASLQQLLHS